MAHQARDRTSRARRVPAAGLDDLTIVLKPDRKQVRAQLAAAKKKGKSKKKD